VLGLCSTSAVCRKLFSGYSAGLCTLLKLIACGMARAVLRSVSYCAVVLPVWLNACAVLSGVVQQFYHYSTHCSRV
jgi:Na+-translocating ferredoxin:NAD+ oxidoreductase RnfE subunit